MGLKPWEFWELRPADLSMMQAFRNKEFQLRMWCWREDQATAYNTSPNFDTSKGLVLGKNLYYLPLYDKDKPKAKRRRKVIKLSPGQWAELVRRVNNVN